VVPVVNPELEQNAAGLSRLVTALGNNVERLLRTYQRDIVDRQYQLGRIADAATELYVSVCVLNRLDRELSMDEQKDKRHQLQWESGCYYLQTAARRMRRHLSDLWDNDDESTTHLADRMLAYRRSERS